jgi:copper(I)-binding protein
MRKPRQFILPAAIAVVLTAAALLSYARGAELIAGDLAIASAWARATPPGASTGAAYITIENRGAADRLLSTSSAAAEMVTLHESAVENGVATMRRAENLTIPAGGRLEMKPGSAHLMLMGLRTPLKEGMRVDVTLVFEKAGSVIVPVEILAIGAGTPMQEHTM